jgi:tetratricopeptide (TPR) repeat protein
MYWTPPAASPTLAAMKTTLALLAVSLGLGGCATQDGHEGHGAAARLGEVRFPVECNAAAQREFDLAMAYYHSFAWAQIQQPLERVLQADPGCGMAYWARALAALDNPFAWPNIVSPAALERGPEFLAKARSTGLKSQRERDYVDALAVFFLDPAKRDHRTRARALEAAMEQLMQRYPQDSEAAILYALVLSANFDPADRTYARQLKAAAVLEPIFKAQPQHPGVAHYLIHSYDYPPIASHGLDAARRYSRIAPDAAHALHMPSHIFTRVGAWQESIESNRESARVAAEAARASKTGRELHDQLHAMDYMVYAHLQLAQYRQAREVVDEMIAMKGFNPAVRTGPYAIAASTARYAVERNDWKAAAELELRPTRFAYVDAITYFARALGAARSGNPQAARADIAKLEEMRDKLRAAKDAYWSEQVEIQRLVAAAWMLYAEGRHAEALATLSKAADAEDRTEKSVVTPGPLAPARELYGAMLLERGLAQDALAAFEGTLAKEPNRYNAIAGAANAAQRLGDQAKAKRYSEKLVALRP